MRPAGAAAIADAARLGFRQVQPTGGDPLLCPFLLEVVATAHAAGLEVEVFTNGLLLGPALLDSLLAYDVRFAFSLYGADAATHDRVSRPPARTSSPPASPSPIPNGSAATAESSGRCAFRPLRPWPGTAWPRPGSTIACFSNAGRWPSSPSAPVRPCSVSGRSGGPERRP